MVNEVRHIFPLFASAAFRTSLDGSAMTFDMSASGFFHDVAIVVERCTNSDGRRGDWAVPPLWLKLCEGARTF